MNLQALLKYLLHHEVTLHSGSPPRALCEGRGDCIFELNEIRGRGLKFFKIKGGGEKEGL